MRATTLLKHDHAAVKKLFREFGRTTERAVKTRWALVAKIATELDVHAQIEEELFYPAMEREDSLLALLEESRHEHAMVQDLVGEVQGLALTDERLRARMRQLRDAVLHHAREEEQEMFPAAERSFDSDELERLGHELRRRKQELLKSPLARMRRILQRGIRKVA